MNISKIRERLCDDLHLFYPEVKFDPCVITQKLIKKDKDNTVFLLTIKNAKGDKREVYVKYQNSLRRGDDIHNEYVMLKNFFAKFNSQSSCFKIPKVLAYYEDINAILTEKARGENFKKILMRDNTVFSSAKKKEVLHTHIKSCAEWLKLFHSIAEKEEVNILSDNFIEKCDDSIALLFRDFDDNVVRDKISDLRKLLRQYIGNQKMTATNFHGDFAPGNILVDENAVCVLDLSYLRKELIYFDVSYFMISLTFINPFINFSYNNRHRAHEFSQLFLNEYFGSEGAVNKRTLFFINLFSFLHLCDRISLHYNSLQKLPVSLRKVVGRNLLRKYYSNILLDKIIYIEDNIKYVF